MTNTHPLTDKPKPYTLHVSDELLKTTKQKLDLARFPSELEDTPEDDWSFGAKTSRVKELAEYWRTKYDWREREAGINTYFKQYTVNITIPDYGPQPIHFVHHPSSSPNAIPLLFLTGWPGSFLETRKIIEPLVSPSDPNTQAFHFVSASLPGFGPFPHATKSSFGTSTAARAFKILMVEVLGYERFVTQGGDFGSWVTRVMAHYYPDNVRACHTNLIFVPPPPVYKHPLVWGRLILNSVLYDEEEKAALAKMQTLRKNEMGYIFIQGTKPQTLAFGLGDSPVGLLAWFVEKLHSWTDTEHYTFSDDEILDWVMMHWTLGPVAGFRMYKAMFMNDGNGSLWPYTTWSSVPYAYSRFPGEVQSPPLDWVRPSVNLKWVKRHDKGGHFVATEQPDLLVGDLREWFGSEEVKKALA